MDRERDEAHLMGQTAGMIAVLAALVEALPPTTRKRLAQQMNTQFDSLLSAMRETGTTTAERQAAEWVRDLFSKQIAKVNKKSKRTKTSNSTKDAVDIQL